MKGLAKATSGPRSATNIKRGRAKRATGNTTRGVVKSVAGERSGLKRSAIIALVVKKYWPD